MPSALVTSGPTHEAIDPVRFIGNRSSGKQGHAIAAALADAGFDVTLISGPTNLPDPAGVTTIHIKSADDMLKAAMKTLPVDIAICAAAVADWKPNHVSTRKTKKSDGLPPMITLVETPDILQRIAQSEEFRPKLVIGFAAETNNVIAYAKAKLIKKGCDWILANQVSDSKGFDADDNTIILLDGQSAEEWPHMSKQDIAKKLVEKIKQHLS